MKKTLGLSVLFLSLTVMLTVPVMAKPTTFTVNYYQAQFQWRAWSPFGSWSYTYQNYATSSNFTLTGKVLHSSWSYSPDVTNLEGASTVYVYDRKNGLWIEHEGTITYNYEPYYGEYAVTNYFRGYIKFDGAPTADSFAHGVAYQWVYIYAPEDDTGVTNLLPNAQWDEVMQAWLIGFSVYLWDTGTQSYNVLFPELFIEPVPANNYNPLDL
jgi:hypothetical protein